MVLRRIPRPEDSLNKAPVNKAPAVSGTDQGYAGRRGTGMGEPARHQDNVGPRGRFRVFVGRPENYPATPTAVRSCRPETGEGENWIGARRTAIVRCRLVK